MKVLICENKEILITAIEFRLRKYGMEIVLANSIKTALKQVEAESPKLLITDQELTDGSGVELIERLREGKKENDLPIILIAELENEEDIRRSFELKVEDFVTKPFKPTELALRALRLVEEI